MQLLLIAVGGALGSVLRYGLSSGIHVWLGRGFPYGTLLVNVAGSFLIGLLVVLISHHENLSPLWRSFLLVGILGGFTTFSSFSLETVELLQRGDWLKSVLNVTGNVLLCLAVCALGMQLGRNVVT